MSRPPYYRLSSLTMDACSATGAAYNKARESWLCYGCFNIRSGFGDIDIVLEAVPDDTPINFVQGTSLGIISTEFLSVLGVEPVKHGLYLGRVFGQNGLSMNDWRTFHGKSKIIVRGSKHVSYRHCEQCGESVYFAMAPKYLYPQPPTDQEIFDGGVGSLVVIESVVQRCLQRKWNKILVEDLPVLGVPTDGLPVLTRHSAN